MPVGPLRPRRQRPRRGAADQCDKVAPFHCGGPSCASRLKRVATPSEAGGALPDRPKKAREHPDLPHLARLLRTCHERPRSRAAEKQQDEVASPHVSPWVVRLDPTTSQGAVLLRAQQQTYRRTSARGSMLLKKDLSDCRGP